jgi:hypothetical protein
VSLKSTGHRNTGTGPKEVKEDPMMTMRTQEQRQRTTVKEQRKSGVNSFFYNSVLMPEATAETSQ